MLKTASINQYCKMTNLSRSIVEKMIKEGTLRHTKTVGGGKTLIIYQTNDEVEALNNKIEKLEVMLKCLCRHLGVQREVS